MEEKGHLPLVICDGCIWGVEIDREELDRAEKEAWSFPGQDTPDGFYYIGSRRRKGETYYYFSNGAGEYRYASKRILEFDRKMKEAEERRKKASRRRWMLPG